MSNNFQEALKIIRTTAKEEVDKGSAFAKLCKIFFENDDIQKQQFSKVWFYGDWAKEYPKFSKTDIGIDLVAKIANEESFCAIQCKCYESHYSIKKEDIDSFISASSNNIFSRIILIDTSACDIGPNAKSVIENLDKTYQRIQNSELEQTRIDWLTYIKEKRVVLNKKKKPLDHQIEAVEAAEEYFKKSDRGKLIMACGTGKTFTSLKIAEKITNVKSLILYMVPSLALMSQSIREWKNDSPKEFSAFSACSDPKVGKKKPGNDEIIINLSDLAFPATTNPKKLSEQVANADKNNMTVIFSTYQSIDVISKAQKEHKLPSFDLIICDEAHRTTGATLTGEDESHFVKIHSDENIKGKKRMYMTATPKIFGDKAKKKAEEGEAELASMDDEATYGKTFFFRGFNWAVTNNLLTDYKVVILAIDEERVGTNIQKSLEEGTELKLDDATKIIGCYKALAKVGFEISKINKKKTNPIKRALAFSQNIEISKIFEKEFQNVVKEYSSNENINDKYKVDLDVEVKHIDGTFNADLRNDRLNWIKENTEKNHCRILTNVRCLSEGVDVPTLDAIMFLHPRKSQIDVVQSVGRVMRKAEGKDMGYVIIPVAVAPGVAPEKALNDNERYEVVWQILNALRAHDDTLDNTINRIRLGEEISDKIEIIGLDPELDAITAEVKDIKSKSNSQKEDEKVIGISNLNKEVVSDPASEQMIFNIGDLSQAIKAKIVEKCGTRDYWENWAADIAKIAKIHISRINSIVLNSKSKERKIFLNFLKEIRDDLNPEISENDAVEMLAQHIITKPVFDSFFKDNDFTKDNAVSRAMEDILSKIYDKNINIETKNLNRFYDSVKKRTQSIRSSSAKTTLINELYERFFKNAFPLTTAKLGIVYTPVEVVDFILNSVNDVLLDGFKKSLNDKNVHILDPFTGTGTFITRLIQSGLIKKDNLSYKYKNEIHANEIVLLAYYIAGINIESVYQEIIKENQYQKFDGIVLTDTFQMYEQERDMVANLLPDNSNKRSKQRNKPITVIIGNPPYSARQQSTNNDAQNVKYTNLDRQIENTYALGSTASNKKDLYDSYIRAFRWASDRIEKDGVIGFVTGAAWIDRSFADGLRKSFSKEFQSLYIINLRGDIRKDILSKGSAKEGENIFKDGGSMTGIAISILVKNSKSKDGKIFYYDIGDNLSRNQKLSDIRNFVSINNISKAKKFKLIKPNSYNDWINQRDISLERFIILGDKKSKNTNTIFNSYSLGVNTNRDAWLSNYSFFELKKNAQKLIQTYNRQITEKKTFSSAEKDPRLIKWSSNLVALFNKNEKITFDEKKIVFSEIKPFNKSYLCIEPSLVDRMSQIKNIFPEPNIENRVIGVTGVGYRSEFSVLMTKNIPNLNFVENGQYFPLKLYSKQDIEGGLFSSNNSKDKYESMDGISDYSFNYFKNIYRNKKFSKEDMFYYIYGILHSEQYRSHFKNNFDKELPRIPAVKLFDDFFEFSKLGRKLANIHVNYENIEPYKAILEENNLELKKKDKKLFYRVEKIKFFGKGKNLDISQIQYNKNIIIKNIPKEAYLYKINSKSIIEIVMSRQSVRVDNESEIKNDPNDYANDVLNNPAYPLELLLKVINVSLQTQKIIKDLPSLDI
jgi:predicted helicase